MYWTSERAYYVAGGAALTPLLLFIGWKLLWRNVPK